MEDWAPEFDSDAENVVMHIGVPPEQTTVLDAIEACVANR
jgi:hypothetical protein